MKKKWKIILVILVISMCLSINAQAGEIKSSNYITSCEGAISSKTSGIKVSFSLTATNTMTDVGASTIYIKSSSGITVKTYRYESYPSMMGHNTASHTSSITYSGGISGHQYYAVIYFKAKNSSGSDTQVVTTSTVTAL